MIQFTCKGCQHQYTVPDEYAARTVRCRKCGYKNTISIETNNAQDMAQNASEGTFVCPKCHTKMHMTEEVRGKVKMCPQCGQNNLIPRSHHDVDDDYAVALPEIPCPYCGRDVPEAATKCRHCGELLSRTDITPPTYQAVKKKYIETDAEMTFSDYIFRAAFKVVKGISVVIIFLCMLANVLCVLGVCWATLHTGTELSIPQFSEYVAIKKEAEKASQGNHSASEKASSDSSGLISWKEYHQGEISRMFERACDKYSLDRGELAGWLAELDESQRESFLSGLNTFLDDSQDYFTRNTTGKTGGRVDYSKGAMYYRDMFEGRVMQIEVKRQRFAVIRWVFMAGVGGSLTLLFTFIALPLLIQIEQNTRM